MFKTKSVHTEVEPHQTGSAFSRRADEAGVFRRIASMFGWLISARANNSGTSFCHGKLPGPNSANRYGKELREGGSIDRRNKKIKNHGQKFTLRLLQHLAKTQTVTLLCHCAEDEQHCHRHLLKTLLEGKVS